MSERRADLYPASVDGLHLDGGVFPVDAWSMDLESVSPRHLTLRSGWYLELEDRLYLETAMTLEELISTTRYAMMSSNLYYSAVWKRLTTASEGVTFFIGREVGAATGEAVWSGRISTDAGTTAGGAATMESVWAIKQVSAAAAADRAVSLELGGGIGGSNRDVTIEFASDASLLWDESDGHFFLDRGLNITGGIVASLGFDISGASLLLEDLPSGTKGVGDHYVFQRAATKQLYYEA